MLRKSDRGNKQAEDERGAENEGMRRLGLLKTLLGTRRGGRKDKVSPEAERLLEQALTHPSYAHEHPDQGGDNQRLEFLGDAVFQLAVSRWLYDRFPEADEGELTRRRAALVSTEALAERARSLHLGETLRLGRGEEGTGGRDRDSNLADTLEAVMGAIYLGFGWRAVERAVHRLFASELTRRDGPDYDAKSRLQQMLQPLKADPDYRLEKSWGPAHHRRFQVKVWGGGKELGIGEGRSKKEAEMVAAEQAIARLLADRGDMIKPEQ